MVPRLRTLHRSRCVLDRPSAFLSEDIGSLLKGGAKVCQRQLVNEVLGPPVTDFALNLGPRGGDTYSGRLQCQPSRSRLARQTHQT
jgi:hypothetical protein